MFAAFSVFDYKGAEATFNKWTHATTLPTLQPVPEPTSFAVLAIGVIALVAFSRRKP